MRRLFVPPGALDSSEVLIAGPDFHHLVHVLRVKTGEAILLLDGVGTVRESVIQSLGKRELTARVTGPAPKPPDPPVHVAVAQALGKGDKFEQVIQHGTELGASEFIPLITARTVVKPDSGPAKLERWRAIAKGAAEQSGRARIPSVQPSCNLRDILTDARDSVLLDPSGRSLASILSGRENVEQSSWLLLVGPEGGFTPEEVEAARAAGADIVSLGPFTLRTETAALGAISRLMLWAELFAGDSGGFRIRERL